MTAPVVFSGSGHDIQAYSSDVTKYPHMVLIANALEVDPALTYRSDSSLRMWYKRYNGWNDAVAKLDGLKAAGQWTLPDVSQTELINLFAGRAYWHSHIKKGFRDIHNYKLMVEWLESDMNDDGPSDLHVWHLEKTHYTFKDLGLWKKDGTLDKDYQIQQKEKGKAKVRTSQRKEKKKQVEPDNSGDESVATRKEKKSSGGKDKAVVKASGSKSRK